VIWVTLDGRQLIDIDTRQQVLHRTGLLLERLSRFLEPNVPPVFVVISHKDFGDPSQASINKLNSEAARLNLSMKIVQVASFSDNDAIMPGTGIAELIDISLKSTSSSSPGVLWPDSVVDEFNRQFLNFRSGKVPS
jgi:hypothetical protein